MRPNPLLILANARTPTQFTHVFAVRHLHSEKRRYAGARFGSINSIRLPKGSST
jgi:hypothetical protein